MPATWRSSSAMCVARLSPNWLMSVLGCWTVQLKRAQRIDWRTHTATICSLFPFLDNRQCVAHCSISFPFAKGMIDYGVIRSYFQNYRHSSQLSALDGNGLQIDC